VTVVVDVVLKKLRVCVSECDHAARTRHDTTTTAWFVFCYFWIVLNERNALMLPFS